MTNGLQILPGSTRDKAGLIFGNEDGILDARALRIATSPNATWSDRQAAMFRSLSTQLGEGTLDWLRARKDAWTLEAFVDEDALRRGWLTGGDRLEIIFDRPSTAMLFKLAWNNDYQDAVA